MPIVSLAGFGPDRAASAPVDAPPPDVVFSTFLRTLEKLGHANRPQPLASRRKKRAMR